MPGWDIAGEVASVGPDTADFGVGWFPVPVDLGTVGPVAAVFDAVPLGGAAAAAVEDRGVVVATRPTPAIVPARGVRQELQLIRLDRELLADLVAQVAAGRLRTRVAVTMPLTEAAEAHRRVLVGGLRGKLVLTVGGRASVAAVGSTAAAAMDGASRCAGGDAGVRGRRSAGCGGIRCLPSPAGVDTSGIRPRPENGNDVGLRNCALR